MVYAHAPVQTCIGVYQVVCMSIVDPLIWLVILYRSVTVHAWMLVLGFLDVTELEKNTLCTFAAFNFVEFRRWCCRCRRVRWLIAVVLSCLWSNFNLINRLPLSSASHSLCISSFPTLTPAYFVVHTFITQLPMDEYNNFHSVYCWVHTVLFCCEFFIILVMQNAGSVH